MMAAIGRTNARRRVEVVQHLIYVIIAALIPLADHSHVFLAARKIGFGEF